MLRYPSIKGKLDAIHIKIDSYDEKRKIRGFYRALSLWSVNWVPQIKKGAKKRPMDSFSIK
ncbi:hypothetical protein D2U88_05025 [Flagellimonas aequoris]|uniref:Uncharacterized protein n=1 Tax=Flagellimonas aequoris TaxID=2306997 RepID=A0A418N9Q2_9FLAO|nr:hypothetical protein D2U88_05025 [Allomuricauda aequoris]